LGLQRVTYEEAVKLGLPAGKFLDGVGAMQFLDMEQCVTVRF
jgi:hypothetical protein